MNRVARTIRDCFPLKGFALTAWLLCSTFSPGTAAEAPSMDFHQVVDLWREYRRHLARVAVVGRVESTLLIGGELHRRWVTRLRLKPPWGLWSSDVLDQRTLAGWPANQADNVLGRNSRYAFALRRPASGGRDDWRIAWLNQTDPGAKAPGRRPANDLVLTALSRGILPLTYGQRQDLPEIAESGRFEVLSFASTEQQENVLVLRFRAQAPADAQFLVERGILYLDRRLACLVVQGYFFGRYAVAGEVGVAHTAAQYKELAPGLPVPLRCRQVVWGWQNQKRLADTHDLLETVMRLESGRMRTAGQRRHVVDYDVWVLEDADETPFQLTAFGLPRRLRRAAPLRSCFC